MNRALQILTLTVLIALLAGVLFVLADLSRHGIRLELSGSIHVTGTPEEIGLRLEAPVTLAFADPVDLAVGGPDGGEIAANLSLLACPTCGSPMLPVRWNPWTGEIEWTCTECGEAVTRPTSP